MVYILRSCLKWQRSNQILCVCMCVCTCACVHVCFHVGWRSNRMDLNRHVSIMPCKAPPLLWPEMALYISSHHSVCLDGGALLCWGPNGSSSSCTPLVSFVTTVSLLQILHLCYFGLHAILSTGPVWADLHFSSRSAAAGRFDRHRPGEDRSQGGLLPTHANQKFFQF